MIKNNELNVKDINFQHLFTSEEQLKNFTRNEIRDGLLELNFEQKFNDRFNFIEKNFDQIFYDPKDLFSNFLGDTIWWLYGARKIFLELIVNSYKYNRFLTKEEHVAFAKLLYFTDSIKNLKKENLDKEFSRLDYQKHFCLNYLILAKSFKVIDEKEYKSRVVFIEYITEFMWHYVMSFEETWSYKDFFKTGLTTEDYDNLLFSLIDNPNHISDIDQLIIKQDYFNFECVCEDIYQNIELSLSKCSRSATNYFFNFELNFFKAYISDKYNLNLIYPNNFEQKYKSISLISNTFSFSDYAKKEKFEVTLNQIYKAKLIEINFVNDFFTHFKDFLNKEENKIILKNLDYKLRNIRSKITMQQIYYTKQFKDSFLANKELKTKLSHFVEILKPSETSFFSISNQTN